MAKSSTAGNDRSAAAAVDASPAKTKPKERTYHLDKELVSRAVTAFLKYHETQSEKLNKDQLFGSDTSVHVQFNLEVAPVSHNPKPWRLSIPHEIYKLSDDSEGENLEEPEVCLIVKNDEVKSAMREMIEKFPQHMGHIKKVLTLDSIRTKHKDFKQRRELMNKYTLFMVDDRIVPMMMKALGRQFWSSGKHPIPMRVSRKETLPYMIQKALKSSYITISAGSCVMVKGGYTGMPVSKLVENCLVLAEQAAEKIPRGWANIRSIGIKTPTSTMLPIYNKTPAELDEIARLAGLPLVYVEDEQVHENTNKKRKKDNDKDETDNDDGMDETGAKKKFELESKSPLLKALKKQKALDKKSSLSSLNDKKIDQSPNDKNEDKSGHANMDAPVLDKKKKRKTEVADEKATCNVKSPATAKDIKKTKEARGNDPDSANSKKKEKKQKRSRDDQDNVVEQATTTNDGKKERETTKSPEPRSAKGDEKAKKAPKTKKKDSPSSKDDNQKKDSSTKTVNDVDGDGDESPDKAAEFIASKTFTKSKQGYVYQKGPQGLGYYVDVRPVVDQAKLAAILKSGNRKGGGTGGQRRGGGRR